MTIAYCHKRHPLQAVQCLLLASHTTPHRFGPLEWTDAEARKMLELLAAAYGGKIEWPPTRPLQDLFHECFEVVVGDQTTPVLAPPELVSVVKNCEGCHKRFSLRLCGNCRRYLCEECMKRPACDCVLEGSDHRPMA